MGLIWPVLGCLQGISGFICINPVGLAAIAVVLDLGPFLRLNIGCSRRNRLYIRAIRDPAAGYFFFLGLRNIKV